MQHTRSITATCCRHSLFTYL